MSGGANNDRFDFNSKLDSATGTNRDVTKDFFAGDKIDLSTIDANERVGRGIRPSGSFLALISQARVNLPTTRRLTFYRAIPMLIQCRNFRLRLT